MYRQFGFQNHISTNLWLRVVCFWVNLSNLSPARDANCHFYDLKICWRMTSLIEWLSFYKCGTCRSSPALHKPAHTHTRTHHMTELARHIALITLLYCCSKKLNSSQPGWLNRWLLSFSAAWWPPAFSTQLQTCADSPPWNSSVNVSHWKRSFAGYNVAEHCVLPFCVFFIFVFIVYLFFL